MPVASVRTDPCCRIHATVDPRSQTDPTPRRCQRTAQETAGMTVAEIAADLHAARVKRALWRDRSGPS